MVHSEVTSRFAIGSQIEVSLAHSGLNRKQARELDRMLQQIPGVLSTTFTDQSVVLHPLSAQYALAIQIEAEIVIQNFFRFDLDGQHVIVGQTN